MEKEIKRDYNLEQLVKRKDNGLIKIVTGIRRCGKSYLLRTLFKSASSDGSKRPRIKSACSIMILAKNKWVSIDKDA